MPQGFGFPVNYGFWVPLRVTKDIADDQLFVFGRLADGLSLSEANAEVTAMGDRMAVEFPQTHARQRPRVLPYTHAFIGIQGPEMEMAMRMAQFGIGLMLLLVAVNVAILVYARTATRMGEIAVRTALGASRGRVVAQLFVEALVPSVVAAAVGLTVLHFALQMLVAAVANDNDGAGRLPILTDFRVTPSVILYVTLLAILAAVIAGVLPALKATGRRVHHGLQQFSTRGAGVQLGPTWTALIVLQVAFAVALLPAALFNGGEFFRVAAKRPVAAAHGLVRASLGLSREGREQGLEKRFPEFATAYAQRLDADPDIAAVTFARRFPGEEFNGDIEIERDGAGKLAPGQEAELIEAKVNEVAVNCSTCSRCRLWRGADSARPMCSRNRRPSLSTKRSRGRPAVEMSWVCACVTPRRSMVRHRPAAGSRSLASSRHSPGTSALRAGRSSRRPCRGCSIPSSRGRIVPR
jgi:hypothetical protein